MPVRKIPKNHLVVTGGFSSAKNERMLGFESLLEWGFMLLLEYDRDVISFEEQPVRIKTNQKNSAGYTPDVLVHYRECSGKKTKKSMLAEIKPSEILKNKKEELQPKFEAAHAYAAERGWEFKVVTEQDIYTPHLEWIKFLRRFHHQFPTDDASSRVLNYMQSVRNTDLASLQSSLATNEAEVLELLPVVWHHVANGDIKTDFSLRPVGNVPLGIST